MSDTFPAVDGIEGRPSRVPFQETLALLRASIEGHGAQVFGEVDHAAAAAEVGLRLRPTTVIVFGNPVAGTPLMADHPLLALELPLRILVWQDDDGTVWVHHLAGSTVAMQFGVAPSAARALDAPAAVIEAALEGAG